MEPEHASTQGSTLCSNRRRFLLASAAVIAVTSANAGAAAAVTPAVAFKDPLFTEPYIDVDEWRDTPVRHRYLHGGFKGTDLRFSIYFPPKEQYQGRFFQHLMAVSGNEYMAATGAGEANDLAFAISSGGYAVESNLGKLDMFPSSTDHSLNTIIGYRASAATAEYSRTLAAEMYGPHRPYGYVWGGSGGSYKTISCMENAPGVWDGAVPYIIPSPYAAPYIYTSLGHAMRILKDTLPAVADAVEPGGGDMYAGLTPDQQAALREVTRMGFPPRAWYKHARLGMGALPVLMDHFKIWDPTYWDDFWTVPGYLGADSPQSLEGDCIRHATTIKNVVMTEEARQRGLMLPMAARAAGEAGIVPAAFEVAELPAGDLVGASLVVKTGEELYITGVVDGMITVGFGPTAGKIVGSIRAGDEVRIDNSTWLAFQTYHRHNVPSADFYIWDQFRGPDGKPLYPQRKVLLGPLMNEIGGGSVQSGRFAGKMIVVNTLMDEHAAPWNADWYRSKVKQVQGDAIDDHFRLWYFDCALHGGPTPQDVTHVVSYTGMLQQALRDLSAWVEQGVPPSPSTAYRVVGSQVVIPESAAERKGLQPVVTLQVDGGTRAEVKAGQEVNLAAVIETPPGAGVVVGVEWDLEGSGTYAVDRKVPGVGAQRVSVTTTHTFSRPGTYFPALRATSERHGQAGSVFARIQNLGRARVVVT